LEAVGRHHPQVAGAADPVVDGVAFLQHWPYRSRGAFLDVSPYVSMGGAVLAP
jgi:hypothetical protein